MVTLDVRLKKVNKVYKEGVRKRFCPDPTERAGCVPM